MNKVEKIIRAYNMGTVTRDWAIDEMRFILDEESEKLLDHLNYFLDLFPEMILECERDEEFVTLGDINAFTLVDTDRSVNLILDKWSDKK